MAKIVDKEQANLIQSDFERVTSAGRSAQLDLADLAALRPSLEDTLAWFYAQDPMFESSTQEEYRALLAGERAGIQYMEYIDGEHRQSQAYELAGVNTLARILRPDIFASQPDAPLAALSREAGKDLTAEDTLAYCLATGGAESIPAEQLSTALAGAEMLTMAASFNENTSDFVRDNIDRLSFAQLGKTINTMQNELTPRKRYLISTASQVCGLIHQRAVELDSTSENFELESVKVKCAIFIASLQLNSRSRPENLADRAYQLTSLEILFATALKFSGQNSLQRRFKGEPGLAGLLHELMWYFDFNLLLQAENDQNIAVTPAISAHDAPKVGFPSLRRGYDFIIHRTDYQRGELGYPVQLKSKPNPKFSKDYHPEIKTIFERNFQDINPRSLEAKLRHYKQFLLTAVERGGFTEGIAPVEKYLLESVKAEYADLKAQLETSKVEARQAARRANQPVSIGGVALNRSLRRALARQKKTY
ncbi:MAG TPA: hypothetical protein VFP35_01875 [Candidatus Saccharimonadales bacterium]|nr:hypothetical protein [Candidatus Saccharimonadales bacterium]